jgi:hypothetical protein
MYFLGLKRAEKKKLETEVISNEARLKLTRLMRKRCESNDANVHLINRNHYINTARAVLGLPIYRLESDDWGLYMNEEFAWHMAESELVMRRPDTAQLVEIVGDMLQQGMLDLSAVNGILAEDNASVRFGDEGFDHDISVRVLSDEEIEDEGDELEHPNIRLLTTRMESAFEQKDYAGVLHASATIFETLAKLVFGNPNVENQTLAGLFDGYRKRSELPDQLLDYILETYKRRNIEPLAGHGATKPPTVTAKSGAVLVEMTKMCVRLERRLALQEIDGAPTGNKDKGSAKSAPNANETSNPPSTRQTEPLMGKSVKKRIVRNKLAAK